MLLVEPDPDLRATLSEVLEDLELEVSAVADEAGVGDVLASTAPGLAIVDVVPPHYAEVALICSLRQRDPELNIVALTSDGGLSNLDLTPIARVLKKPFDLDDLIRALRPRSARLRAVPAPSVAEPVSRRGCAAR